MRQADSVYSLLCLCGGCAVLLLIISQNRRNRNGRMTKYSFVKQQPHRFEAVRLLVFMRLLFCRQLSVKGSAALSA